jgi:transposase
LEEDAKKLKKVKYILMSYKATLIDKDKKTVNYNKDLNEQPNTLLKKRALPKTNDNFSRHMDLIKNNKLYLVCDTIKEELKYAYKSSCKIQMFDSISNIIKICKGTCNTHFQWFARLLSNHIEDIITHAIYKVTNGKIDGINQRIKTLRRKCYGLPKDLYFFLKLMHESRKTVQKHLNTIFF